MTSSEKPSAPHGTKDKTPATSVVPADRLAREERFDHQAVSVRCIAQSAEGHGEAALGLGVAPGVDAC